MYFRPVFLHGLHELLGLFERSEHGRHRGHHVLAVVEHLDAMPRVAGGVGGHEDRLDLRVFDQLFERVIRLAASAGLHQAVSPLGDQVADRDDLDVGMVLETELGPELAHAVPDDADADLAVGDRLPSLARSRLLFAWARLAARAAAGHRPQREHAELLQELPSNHRYERRCPP